VREVDPWRFTGGFLKGVLSGGIPDEPSHPPIPWTPVTKPLAEAKVALLSTAGLSMKSDTPFDMEFERQHPTKGDGSWRRIAADASAATVDANHLHIDTGFIGQDLNVALPLDRLRELVAEGKVGAMAETHYSVMGYQGNDPSRLVEESAPAIAESLKNEGVDQILLTPV
jgi:D-proline reductase (dithiol) PrdB